jgi:CO/xanthine dehydrogenase FAD-binding subunit
MHPFDLCSPHTLDLACRALAGRGGPLIAGSTNLIPQVHAGRLAVERLVDLSHLHDLRYIVCEDGMLHIGALTTFAALLCSPLLRARAPALARAAALVGAVQTRNRGTVGANIANASPAGDTLPPRLAMDALATLIGAHGDRRRVPACVMIRTHRSAVRLPRKSCPSAHGWVSISTAVAGLPCA